MKIERNTIISTICLSIGGLIGIYSDFFMSYNAYQTDSLFFVRHEANREIVNFFHNNEFPFFFLLSVIVFPIGMFIFCYILQNHKNYKHRKECIICLILFVYFLSLTRITAGMTWYVKHITNTVFSLQTISYIFLGALACFLYLMYKEAKEDGRKNNVKISS